MKDSAKQLHMKVRELNRGMVVAHHNGQPSEYMRLSYELMRVAKELTQQTP